jgi:hypothetical protein
MDGDIFMYLMIQNFGLASCRPRSLLQLFGVFLVWWLMLWPSIRAGAPPIGNAKKSIGIIPLGCHGPGAKVQAIVTAPQLAIAGGAHLQVPLERPVHGL